MWWFIKGLDFTSLIFVHFRYHLENAALEKGTSKLKCTDLQALCLIVLILKECNTIMYPSLFCKGTYFC